MFAVQNQDGKVVSPGSGCELSEMMKRRLESVASTGSSASSGFIEDKSYCDSEEEEEGKGQARLTSFPAPTLCLSLLLSPSPSAPPLLQRNQELSSDCFPAQSDGMFPPPVQHYNHCSRSHCHPTETGEASVCFLSWPECSSALRLQLEHGMSAMLSLTCYF